MFNLTAQIDVFGAFLLFLLLLEAYSWYAIDPAAGLFQLRVFYFNAEGPPKTSGELVARHRAAGARSLASPGIFTRFQA